MYIVGGRIKPMSGEDIPDGVIHIMDGKIAEIGKKGQISLSPKEHEQVLVVKEGLIMPGLIEAHCHMGITEEKKGMEGDRDQGRRERMLLLGLAPVARFTISPPRMTTRVGMLLMLKAEASSGSSSTLTLPTRMSGRSAAISSTTGETMRQGPHQLAQKSRSTGFSLPFTSAAKLEAVIFTADIFNSSCVLFLA